MEFLKRVTTFAGRSLELALTGQTSYAVITSELAEIKQVTDLPKGKRVLAEARQLLEREFGMAVRNPVLLELFDGKDWSPSSLRYVMRGAVGSYQPQKMGGQDAHAVHVLSGLSRGRFKAIVAHEMVHAYEREAAILTTHRPLREGLARWVEYKILQREGEKAEAEKLVQVRRWSSGRSIHELLEIEAKRGVAGVLDYVRGIP